MKSNILFLVMGLLIGCASSFSNPLRLLDRELLIHPDKPGLGYPYKVEVCEKRRGLGAIFGKKCRDEFREDVYDLNDKAVRKSLIDAGFTCKSPSQFKY